MVWKIPLFKSYWDKEDIKAVSTVIKRGTYWATGPEIQEFERVVASFIGRKYALAFNSGTSALHALLLAHNIKNKEVIVPSFTFIATANTVILAGGKPVFAETEPETYGLDVQDVKKKITKKTKAIMQLHYGGFPGRDTEKLRELADEKNILLLEDAAESFGAMMGGKKVGSFGKSSMFSFCQSKAISTGEGGVIVTDSEEIFEKCKLIRSHGRVEEGEDYFSSIGDNDYVDVGYNFRLASMNAALGLSQLKKLKKIVERRRKIANYMTSHLSKIRYVTVPKELPGHFSIYQMYTIQLKNKHMRDKLQKYLAKKGIMSKVYFNPIHLKSFYKKKYRYKEGSLPQTEELSNRILNIPLFPTMKRQEASYLINSIKEFFTFS
jgi:dTDP-4-amino-4,6-dideoxygalactose transaminase